MAGLSQRQSARNIRKSLRRAGAGLLLLLAGLVLGGLAASPPLGVFFVTAGFLGLVVCVHRSLALWNVDAVVFEDFSRDLVETGYITPPSRTRRSGGLRNAAPRLIGLAVLALLPAVGHARGDRSGEASPDPIVAAGRWTVCCALENGGSRGDGPLIEIGLP